MLIRSKKTNILLIVVWFSLILTLDLCAQQPAPSVAPSTPDNNQALPSVAPTAASSTPAGTANAGPSAATQGSGQVAPQVPSGADSSTSSALDYLFNHKPQQGSVAKEGMQANEHAKTEALAQDALGNQQIDDPIMRARFDTYLAMNEVPQDQLKSYANDMNTVIDLLHQRKTTEAWQKLYQLAKYQTIDAGVSWELANRIESIWNADQTKYQIAQQNSQLQKQSDTDNRNADQDSADVKDKELEYQRRMEEANAQASKSKQPQETAQANGGVPQVPQGDNTPTISAPISDQLLGKLQLTQEYLDSLASQAKIKMNEMKVDKLFDQAKQDFADYITTLYKSGRYQHVLIAARLLAPDF